jgi:hypothetical protein
LTVAASASKHTKDATPESGRLENRLLVSILLLGAALRVGMAFYLGNQVDPVPAAYDQVFYHDVALNLLAGRGFSFTNPPWPFIEPGAPTAYVPFLYQLFLAGVYKVAGVYPLVARIVQALMCSLLPWLVYLLTRRIVSGSSAAVPSRWQAKAGAISLTAAAITAFYAYFVFYSAALMTEGLYLLMVAASLLLTYDLAGQSMPPSIRRWAAWGLATGVTIVMRQVFMPVSAVLFLWVAWRLRGRHAPRVWLPRATVAVAVIAAVILPWTIRNYLVFDRFLLLNSQTGQVFWNANHPYLGTEFEGSPMFQIPADLEGTNEAVLDRELMKRGLQLVLDDPMRFVLLSLDRIPRYFWFWPSATSSTLSNVSRTLSFGLFVPFMIVGIVLSLREWRRWSQLYVFILLYSGIHVVSWVQVRYRMPVDLALVPFAALALVALTEYARSRSGRRVIEPAAMPGGSNGR